eukprot:g18247.t1
MSHQKEGEFGFMARVDATQVEPPRWSKCIPVPLNGPRFARLLYDVHGYEIFQLGLFNSDPHAGNVFMMPDGKLGLIDYGACMRLTATQRTCIAKLLIAIADEDDEAVRLCWEGKEVDVVFRKAPLGFRLAHKQAPLKVANINDKGCVVDDNLDVRAGWILTAVNGKSLTTCHQKVPPAFWACGFRSKNQDPRLALLLAHVFFNRGPYPYDMSLDRNRLAPKVGMPVDIDIMTLDSYLRGGELDDIEDFPGHLVMLQRCAMVLSGLALELGAGRLSSAQMLKPQAELWLLQPYLDRAIHVPHLERLESGVLDAKANWAKLEETFLQAAKIFLVVGFLFGCGDYLEMRSLVSLGGGAYQILLQSRLLITALMLWAISGQRQSLFQWNLLALVVCSMSVYMCLDLSGDESNSSQKLLGTFNVLLKVAVSCLAAVLTDRYTKQFNDPVYVQAIQLRLSRTLLLSFLVCFDGQSLKHGFFHGWDACTVAVAVSHMLKAWSTLYLLVYLDSVLKNMGEALAVLVTYLLEICLPTFGTPFEVRTLLAVLVVMLSVYAYISSKSVVAKSMKYEQLLGTPKV